MDIKKVNRSRGAAGSAYTSDNKRVSGTSPQTFERHFNEQSQEKYRQEIERLTKSLDAQAETLAKKIDIYEFEKYRRLIGELINEVVSNAYAFKKENVLDARGRRKVYALIQTVDERLDQMAADVINRNIDSIGVLARVDDIRGLILDMML